MVLLNPDVKLEAKRAVQASGEIRPDVKTGRVARGEGKIRRKKPIPQKKTDGGRALRTNLANVANVAKQVPPKCWWLVM